MARPTIQANPHGMMPGRDAGSWLVLSLLGAGLVLFGAAYGGSLVFEYGSNVEKLGEVGEASSTDRSPPVCARKMPIGEAA